MNKILVSAVMFVLILLLASCSKPQDTGGELSGESNASSNGSSDVSSDDTVNHDDSRTVLTIGGIYVPHDMRSAISRFNRASDTYQIEIIEYIDYDATFEEWQGGFTRLQMDLMTGSGPDIIFDPQNQLGSHDYLIDLLLMIDADPEINRLDLSPNVVHSMEAPDGRLPLVSIPFSHGGGSIGISTESGNQEGSWRFVRRFLLLEIAEIEDN